MDFYTIKEREAKTKGVLEVYPDFKVLRSKDLMVRAKSFYAIWDEGRQLWSTDEFDVQRLVDEDIRQHEVTQMPPGITEVHKKYLGNFSSNVWLNFRNYVGHLSDSYHPLDSKITFADDVVKKEDFVSKRVDYSPKPGSIDAYTEIFTTLYTPEELDKLEWAIGAILTGDSTKIQKFLVLYGKAGSGKSTWIKLLEWLTEGYYSAFNAKELTSANNSFALEAFKSNPIVAIEHDGDLSKISDNSKLNSIVSHEPMEINEKNKPKYMIRPHTFLVIGSNSPVKFTDAKSGLTRRLIDVRPSGELLSPRKYQTLTTQMKFELGAIAYHCIEKYRSMGKDYYENYRAVEMMLQTDVFFNYIEAHYDIFKAQDGVTLRQAYDLYKVFCEDTNVEYKMPQYKFREELKNYFTRFDDRTELADGTRVRSWYSGFNADKFKVQIKDDMVFSLVLDEKESLLDERYQNYPAQYATEDGTPPLFWSDKPRRDKEGKEYIPKKSQVCSTILKDLDTSREHYVNIDEREIVIDFDLTDEKGNKSLEKNLEAASQWPPTYAELSKSGKGIHLHYFYDGDPTELARVFEPGIEVKVYTGDQALRRKLTRCNNIPVATISTGLPKKEKKVMNTEGIKSEKALRALILKNLRKEIHPATKPSIDFIAKILDDAYHSGLRYDVTDLRNKLLGFANGSTNNALYCIKKVQEMRLAAEEVIFEQSQNVQDSNDSLEGAAVFDVEVFPNLFVVCWKYLGDTKSTVRMINPSPQAVEELITTVKLIGFNNRRYDNHILYAASMGYSNEELFKLSSKIVEGSPNAFFGEAYNLSYTDIYDFASAANKKGLKKWQIELDLNHKELGLPWDQPVPEKLWKKVVDYCVNDVITTEQVFYHLEDDFTARRILAALSGLSVNDTTNKHSIKIMFGDNRKPQDNFNYTDLSETFPGYKYEFGKSTYRGEEVGEGGLVRGKPGMYTDVAVLDVASMHPTSIEQLDLFGSYTQRFSEIKKARVLIKRGDFETARQMLEGKLAPYLQEEGNAKGLSDALKTVINSIYGLTAARFDNAFRDPRNIDNIVAKRGALFMLELMFAVQDLGYEVVHIKTDSIKIPNADKMIIDYVMDFGDKYGYEFEHEATYEKFCLVNDAVYIAKTKPGRTPAHWEAVGAQFQHPYVFKTLFTKEKITLKDMCETKSVSTAIYMDFDRTDPNIPMVFNDIPDGPMFVGKAGVFCPVIPGAGGGDLLRLKSDGSYTAVTGTKGYKWLEASVVKELKMEDKIDHSYFRKLVDDAVANMAQYGDVDWFTADD